MSTDTDESSTIALGEINKYDFRTDTPTVFKARRGLDRDIVSQISEMKKEPAWMRDFRLKSLDIFNSKQMPNWGGNIGIVVKRVPLLGRVTDNVFYSMGYSGHGVAPTHIAAEVMANALAGDTEVLEAYENIKHWRIPFGQWFGNQVVALGMLYFRALDLSPL